MKKLSYILIMCCLPLCLKAQVHYTDIIPDTTITADSGAYNLDLDNSGIAEYRIEKIVLDTVYLQIQIDISPLNNNFLVAYFDLGGGCIYADRFNFNDSIPFSYSEFTHENAVLSFIGANYCGHNGAFTGKSDSYIGLRMYNNDTVFYGWIRVDVDTNAAWITIKDYAYCANGILAGQTFNGITDQDYPELTIKENEEDIIVTPAKGQLLNACIYDLLSRESTVKIEDRSVMISKKNYKPGVYVLFLKTSLDNASVKLVIRP
jgi:hypothetical protein